MADDEKTLDTALAIAKEAKAIHKKLGSYAIEKGKENGWSYNSLLLGLLSLAATTARVLGLEKSSTRLLFDGVMDEIEDKIPLGGKEPKDLN